MLPSIWDHKRLDFLYFEQIFVTFTYLAGFF